MLDFIMNLFGYENINKILIQKDFKCPRKDKIIKKAKFYSETGKYQEMIIINQDKILLDGFSTYMICHNQGKKYVKILKIYMDPKVYREKYKTTIRKTKEKGDKK